LSDLLAERNIQQLTTEMPEGNELHRHAMQHKELFGGRVITVEGPNGRFEEDAALLNRRKLRAVEAYGKHLLYEFGRDRYLHIHLGLYGKFRTGELPFPEPRGALRLRFSSARHWLELRGPTVCEVVTSADRDLLVARIGPDPLREDADSAAAVNRMLKSRAPIGALLMDQAVISGIGNIYRAELLFRARLNPFRAGNTIPKRALVKLWKDAQLLMCAGMIDRRIVTTRPADRPHRNGKARRGETHYVYRRHRLPCFICGTEISRQEFIGRKLYWCPACQSAGESD
jgi:formamidopyrimidine-DNA glycosylase